MAQRRKDRSHNKIASNATRPLAWDEAVRRFRDHLIGPAESSRLTIETYSRDLAGFRAWWRDARPDQELTPSAILGGDLREWKEFVRAERIDAGTPKERVRKPASTNAKLACLRSFLAWAESAGVIAEAPAFPKRVKAVRPGYKAVPKNDQRRLIRAIEGKGVRRDVALVLTLFDCGLRVSELCALRWRDVAISPRKGDLAVWEGKGGKHRSVPISARCRAALLELRASGVGPDDPVFGSRKGGKTGRGIGRHAVYRLLERYAAPLGIKISPHMLRHSCAKDMLDRGNQVTAVQAILGHESVNTTLGYLTSSPDDLRRAVERDAGDVD